MITDTPFIRSTGAVRVTSQAEGSKRSRRYAGGRTCEASGCSTRLSTYNPRRRCWIHDEPRPTYLRIRPRVEEGPSVTSLKELISLLPRNVDRRHLESPADRQPEPFPTPRPLPRRPEDPS